MNPIINLIFSFFIIYAMDKIYKIIVNERNNKLEKAKLKVEVAKIIAKEDFYRFKDNYNDKKDPFKVYCGNFLKTIGFTDVNVSDDKDKEIIAFKDGEKYYIECSLKDNIKKSTAQRLVGAMVKDQVKKGIIITINSIAYDAKQYAADISGIDLQLIDGNDLIDMLGKLRKEWIPELEDI